MSTAAALAAALAAVLDSAIAAADVPDLGELVTIYANSPRAALVSAVCAAVTFLEQQA